MENEEKLQLKIVALRETHTRRLEQLDDLVADLRVELTEKDRTLRQVMEQLSASQQELASIKENYVAEKEEDLPNEN